MKYSANSEKKLKVLFVVWGLRYGGGETRIYNLARFMGQRGHDVTVCCLRVKGERGEQLEAGGGKVICLGKKSRYNLGTLPRLVRLMRRERYDVVDGQMASGFTWGCVAAKIARVPRVVGTIYNSRFWKSRLRRLRDTFCLMMADVIVTDSRNLIDEICDYSPVLRRKPFRVVYNGIDLATNGPIRGKDVVRRELGAAPDDVLVGMVARIVSHKGHTYFLEAAKRIAEEFPKTRFFIVGLGAEGYEKVVERQIKEMGLGSRVSMFQYDGNIFDIMSVLDIYVLPSFSESLPNAVVEAMWTETPVIITDITGHPEAVKEGETGFLVPTGDSDTIYERLKYLLSDGERRREMGRKAREFAGERFSPRSLCDGALKVYRGE